MTLASLHSLRARQKREHRQSSRTSARLYDAVHDQLRRDVRRTRFVRAAENVAAVLLGVLFLVLLSVLI